jgi:hypothetical protein
MPDQPLPPHNEVKTGAARDPQPGLVRRLLERSVDRVLAPRKGGRR